MAIKTKVFLLGVLLVAFSFEMNAQNTTKSEPLVTVLEKLQNQFNVQFNFAEDLVKSIKIAAPSGDLSLTEVLLYLEENTSLSFTETEDNIILVQSKSKSFGLQQLSEIVLSQFIVKGINKIDDGSFAIDFSEFDMLPGLVDADVLQAVQAFPGIQSSNETVSNINIRGGTHDQNLILWDGIKMYQSGHFFGLVSMFNPQITQQVNLIKNGTDASLNDGVSGTIAMETSAQVNDSIKASIGANFVDANGFVDLPLGKRSSIQIATRKSISDIAKTPTYTNYFQRIAQDSEIVNNQDAIINSDQEFDFYDASLRWIYHISDKDKVQLNFITTGNELMFNENAFTNDEQRSRESSVTQHSIAGALMYHRIWNADWQSTFEVYESDYKLKAINADILEAQRFLQENVVSETSLKLITNYKANETLRLKNGYHFVETGVSNLDDVDNPLFRLKVAEVVRTHALFSQLNFRAANQKTQLKFGLRYNYIDKFNKHLLEPRFALFHDISTHFSIEVLGEFKHQNTSQVINFQNDFLGIEKRRWQLSNDLDIPVIRSKQGSIGLTYNKKGWLLNTEAYYKSVDGITTQSQGFLNQYEFVRTSGDFEAFGLDILLRKQIRSFNAWLSYSYLDSHYKFSELPEPKFPSNFDITHALTLGTAYVVNDFKISAGLNWHSGIPSTQPAPDFEIVDGMINYTDTNSTALADYMRVDLSATYSFGLLNNTRANLGVSVWNLLDRTNEISAYYRINNSVVNESLQTSLGITPNVFFRIYFE